MMRFPLLIIAILCSFIAVAQEQCTTPDESIADPNSITKCAVEDVKDADGTAKKQVSIEVSTRRRVVRKNSATALSESKNSHKLANIKKNTLLVGKLELDDNSANISRIPFNLVEEIPLFSKCESEPLIKQAKCFEGQIAKHIVRNFQYPEEALERGIEGRVLVQFTINELGDVEDIKLRGPKDGDLLVKEAKRIVTKLPKFLPGKHNGKTVKVKYGIPITFKVPGGKSKSKKKVIKKTVVRKVVKAPVIKEEKITDVVSFNKVQTIPQFKKCSNASDVEKLNCFNERMISHIQRNFNYPDGAAAANIEGKVWVTFIINKQGKVRNIRMRGPKNGHLLELEAKKMVANLPDFVPGKHNGSAANVEYTIPITFKLH